MKKAAIVVGSYYKNNKIFDINDEKINRDNCIYPFYLLRSKMKVLGYDLATSDIHSTDDADVVLYIEMPKRLPAKNNIDKSYLVLFESELIRPDNWDLKKHAYFRKIFTWHDDFVDGKKYFKINFSQDISSLFDKSAIKEKLCTLIASNKLKAHPLELYSKRIEAIKWFEKNHPEDFEFYGVGWDNFVTKNKYINFALSKFPLMQKYLAHDYASYRGKIKSKHLLLSKYKFAICYENAKDIPGYITEKILDCLKAGCIPIYLGADNITDYIPEQCFIDKRKFDTYEALYEYIKNMSDEVYERYLHDVDLYLIDKKALVFTNECFTNTILDQISLDHFRG